MLATLYSFVGSSLLSVLEHFAFAGNLTVQRSLEWELQEANEQLRHVDEHEWYTRDVAHCERVVEEARKKMQAATTDEERDHRRGVLLWLEVYVNRARRHQQLFETDREMFVERRRHELTVQMIALHNDLTRLYPQWRWESTLASQPQPHTTPPAPVLSPDPVASPTPTSASSLRHRHRRTLSL